MSAVPTYAEQNHYDTLSKFETIKEFNNHFEQAMILHKDKFTKSEYVALNKLRKFAANFYGVAWCKIQRVVSSTHTDEMFGVSRSTFERMIRKAKKLNLITVINQERKNKWKKHNVYVFNRLEELVAEEVEIVSKSHTIDVSKNEKIDVTKTNNLSELSLDKKNTYQQAEPVGKQKDNVIDFKKPLSEFTNYEQLKYLVSSFIGDKKLASKFYGIWLAQVSRMINKPDFDLAMKAAKATLYAMKNKNLTNPGGYFNNALSRMIDKWIEQDLVFYQENQDELFTQEPAVVDPTASISNWLEENEINWVYR